MSGWRKRTIMEMAHGMNAIEQLKSVLCDPTGKCCIKGSEEDRAIVDRALQALAQPAPVKEPVAYCEIHYLPEPCAQCSKEHEGYNTSPAQPAPVQPVAYCKVRPLRGDESFPKIEIDWVGFDWPMTGPLYATPPAQRTWVGLTNKDIIEIWPQTSTVGWDDILLIESKLKEKNFD